MIARIRKTLDSTLIGVAAAWPACAAFYLGLTAHGQYLSTIRQVNLLATIIVGTAVVLRTSLWIFGGDTRRPLLRHLLGQLGLLAGAVCLYRLGFQSGLAVHCPPESFLAFFTMDP